MSDQRYCGKCGRAIPIGEAQCPDCAPEVTGSTLRVETIFGLSLVIVVILFAVTGFAVQMYHAKEHALGQEWFEQGSTEMKTGQPENALTDFRTALVYDRNNDTYEFSLAKALLAAHHPEEAQAHLTSLWERQPESGEVNLELGRLAAQRHDIIQALRYYHNSIYGDWMQEDAAEQRRDARLELYRFLMHQGANSEAEAELLAMAAELPPDPLLHIQVGQMFLDAHQFIEAEKQFLEALRFGRNNTDALAGAGEAEFQMGEYRNSAMHLERALRKESHNWPLAKMQETARLVLSIDPFDPEISNAERSARVVRAFNQAADRLQECTEEKDENLETSPPQSPMQHLLADGMKIRPRVNERFLNRAPDSATQVLDWVGEVENLAATTCGPPTGLDEAIVLSLRKHEGVRK